MPERLRKMKRLMDIFLSLVALLISSPLWVIVPLLIKLEDGGPVFYAQKRIGKEQKIFCIWKFRSMIENAEKGLGPIQSSENDPRITKIGSFLRSTALDELPQLVSIFLGDMSFVGPRALRPGEKEALGDGTFKEISEFPGAEERLSVVPGLTGLAQIYGSHDTPRRNKFRYDLLYIKKKSFLLDLRLVVFSVLITLRGKWEHRGKKM